MSEVKIYREPENESLIVNEEDRKAYNELAAELGLASKEDVEENRTPNIYLPLNATMARTLRQLCPTTSEVADYNNSTIPLEVLKVYKYCKDNKMFDFYKIWHANEDPDPILIGFNYKTENDKECGYTWNTNRAIIARWGDCAYELPELLQMGRDSVKEELLNKAMMAKTKLDGIISNTEAYANEILNGVSIRYSLDLSTKADNSI